MAAEISQVVPAMCKKANAENAMNEKRFIGLTRHKISDRWREQRLFFIILNSSFSLAAQRPAVGSSDWVGIWCDCLLGRSLGRVMVGNQPPAPLLLYPHPGKASVTGDSLSFILPIHY